MKYYQINKIDKKELLYLYKEIIKSTSILLKDKLDLDSITKYCAAYFYLYNNGYLSLNHTFRFSDTYSILFDLNCDILGLSLVTGTGVCRNITPFFTDLLNEMNYNCYNLTLDDISRFKNSERIVLLYTKLFPKLLGTHVINYIKDGNKSIIFDANDSKDPFPKLIDKRIVKYNYQDNHYVAWFVNEINRGIIMPSLKEQDNYGNIEEFLKTLEMLDSNKDILNNFYRENRMLYHEAHLKVESEVQKELVFYNSFKIK